MEVAPMWRVYRANRTCVRSNAGTRKQDAGNSSFLSASWFLCPVSLGLRCAQTLAYHSRPVSGRRACARQVSERDVVQERGIPRRILERVVCRSVPTAGPFPEPRMTVVEMAAASRPNWRVKYEGSSFDEEDVREVSHHPPARPGLGDLREPSPQAEAGLTWLVLQE